MDLDEFPTCLKEASDLDIASVIPFSQGSSI
jgi:hypothetical protein